jgi:hypothetical protein
MGRYLINVSGRVLLTADRTFFFRVVARYVTTKTDHSSWRQYFPAGEKCAFMNARKSSNLCGMASW